ncbi:IscS subfamily cysteine desulfurase [Falsibacillus albus]|uniref:Aminotransferase class V-fold PLP-dependent enzyme n=1 Tax=Falsibacillus albus TaxID=2478915 RepID=A0A3L7K641_9BACI|nr:IscS subfamily cysteine desulfurase [Falsibacillus albus]RLQ98075.1 aminotransferase class V-fold PLP-dependent enzyme [Falsibacillus albus]
MKYFDYAASTPLDPKAQEAFCAASEHAFANTESLHDSGSRSHFLLEQCRSKLADYLGVSPEGIYFTSGGTESNLLAIISLVIGQGEKKHLITSHGEHSSIHSAMDYLAAKGYEISYVSMTKDGMVDLEELSGLVRKDTALVSIQHVNSEIGTIQPIPKISALLKRLDILFHCDCVQSFGKLELKEISPYVDSLSISSHKIYGPKGVGALYVNPVRYWEPVFPHLAHEKGMRGGTVNLPGIAAFISAVETVYEDRDLKIEKAWKLRSILFDALQKDERFTFYHNEEKGSQVPHIVGLSIRGVEGQLAMLEANSMGFAISTGSACGIKTPSKVMNAMKIGSEEAKCFIRISMGRHTKAEDVLDLAGALSSIAQKYSTQTLSQ